MTVKSQNGASSGDSQVKDNNFSEKPSSGMMVDEEQQNDRAQEFDEKLINEEYKVWKKNSPFLYDLVITHALEWPTLTVQWLPDRESPPSQSFSNYRVILGTHTSGSEPNYLQFAQVQIPNPTSAASEVTSYDPDKGEIGGFTNKSSPKISVTQRILHDGEVNRARYMPQNPDIVATMSPTANAYIFDRTKHTLNPSGSFSPQMKLRGHTKEGFGLSWNSNKEGWLVTGSEDCTARLWNITSYESAKGGVIEPYRTYSVHTAVVNDVAFHPLHDSVFGTISDDQMLHIQDTRRAETNKAARTVHAHSEAINALAFSPSNEYVLATASADKTIGLWDIRNLNLKLHSFEGHDDEVTSLQWAPHDETILASASIDRRVLIWNLSKIGEEQSVEDAEDGPPELMFMHGGHTNRVSDIGWFPSSQETVKPNDIWGGWLIASAAEDNILQVWSPSRTIWGKEEPVAASELE